MLVPLHFSITNPLSLTVLTEVQQPRIHGITLVRRLQKDGLQLKGAAKCLGTGQPYGFCDGTARAAVVTCARSLGDVGTTRSGVDDALVEMWRWAKKPSLRAMDPSSLFPFFILVVFSQLRWLLAASSLSRSASP